MKSKKRKKIVTALLLLILLGCGSKSDSSGVSFVSIDVSPPSPSIISFPYTQQFTAIARDSSGNGVSGVVFTWSDSGPASCIDQKTGLASAKQTFGTDTITATAGNIAGSTPLFINIQGSPPPPPPPNCL
ncbi:MAG: Ig-like domain-containing protein [Nitrospirae bacterium]|nr:Ig-like domain-containing protein [Nitrospirota bacterium]